MFIYDIKQQPMFICRVYKKKSLARALKLTQSLATTVKASLSFATTFKIRHDI